MIKVLVLTVTAGEGHNAAAKAITTYFEKHYQQEVEVKLVDMLKPKHPYYAYLVNDFYFWSIRWFPWIVRSAFKFDARLKPNKKINASRNAMRLIYKDMVEEFDKFKPNIVLSTHPFGTAIQSLFKEAKKFKFDGYHVTTDYVLLPDQENAYNLEGVFSSSKHLESELIKKFISKDKIYLTGIPVQEKFENQSVDTDYYKPLNFDEKIFTILIMNGGQGAGRALTIIKSLERIDYPLQVIVVNGRNKKNFASVQDYLPKVKETMNVVNYGFVTNIHELMLISDIYVGKVGGITTTECIKMGLPIIIPEMPPAQEIFNMRYLLENKAAIYAKTVMRLSEKVEDLIKNPQSLIDLKKNMSKLNIPNSAANICKIVLENYSKNKNPQPS
jgi:processive 1,2-diacylglycerol beta-glucosyltransferase